VRRSRSLLVIALLWSFGTGAACGGDGPVESKAPPPSVPDAVVPTLLEGGDIALHENVDKETVDAFANGGRFSLLADGRLWELRQGARLVGALQVSTVVDRIDLADPADRQSILRQVLPGNLNQLLVDEVPVWAAEANDKIVYVWFATNTFQVLQLKGSSLEPEALLQEVIAHQRASDQWLPLPPESYDD
jgi:hypothetical protein